MHALKAVAGLQAGRCEAKDHDKVKPVDDATVDATIKKLSPLVAAMVQVQRLAGMRPGEVCSMRRSEIDISGPVWLYRPANHKTAWRGKDRVIGIGPKAQAILKPFLTDNPDGYLFSPVREQQERHATLRRRRKSKVQPSQRSRRKEKRKREPQPYYSKDSYRVAINRACDRAFPPPKKLVGEELAAWQKAHRWHPNQLRHAFGTQVRRAFGLEAAQVGLGHSEANITQVYAEADTAFIAKIAAEIG